MALQKETIVIVGSGNIAQYIIEEFVRSGTYNVAVISRTRRTFLENLLLTLFEVEEYSQDAVQDILKDTSASALISTLQSPDAIWYNTVHECLLAACRESRTCKRFVSSEYMGNLRDFPHVPRGNYYARQPFRLKLAAQTDVMWTLVNQGWLADYFVQTADGSKSYIRPFPAGWPIDLEQRTVRITGTGNELVGWTAARDMAKAVVKLMSLQDWPDHVYVFGELGTWNTAVEKLEAFLGRKLERIERTEAEMQKDLLQATNRNRWYTATMDEWSFSGRPAVPREKALAQREKYFNDVHFRLLEEIFEDSTKTQIL